VGFPNEALGKERLTMGERREIRPVQRKKKRKTFKWDAAKSDGSEKKKKDGRGTCICRKRPPVSTRGKIDRPRKKTYYERRENCKEK